MWNYPAGSSHRTIIAKKSSPLAFKGNAEYSVCSVLPSNQLHAECSLMTKSNLWPHNNCPIQGLLEGPATDCSFTYIQIQVPKRAAFSLLVCFSVLSVVSLFHHNFSHILLKVASLGSGALELEE
jgi:hypothetical protein